MPISVGAMMARNPGRSQTQVPHGSTHIQLLSLIRKTSPAIDAETLHFALCEDQDMGDITAEPL